MCSNWASILHTTVAGWARRQLEGGPHTHKFVKHDLMRRWLSFSNVWRKKIERKSGKKVSMKQQKFGDRFEGLMSIMRRREEQSTHLSRLFSTEFIQGRGGGGGGGGGEGRGGRGGGRGGINISGYCFFSPWNCYYFPHMYTICCCHSGTLESISSIVSFFCVRSPYIYSILGRPKHICKLWRTISCIPTNKAPLANFRLSSDAEIFVNKHRSSVQIGATRAQNVCAMCMYSNRASILHATVGGWAPIAEKKTSYTKKVTTPHPICGNANDSSSTVMLNDNLLIQRR